MSRAQIVITNEQRRAEATKWVASAPIGTFIEFRDNKRSLPQNDRMHAMIRDVAEQLLHHGQRLDIDDWKLVFLNALGKENRVVKDLYGVGRVNLTPRTSKLTKEEASQLMELIMAYGTEHGVKFHDDPVDHRRELHKIAMGPMRQPAPKLNKKAKEPRIEVVWPDPRKGDKRTDGLPSTTEGYRDYAQARIDAGATEDWFLSPEQVALRQDCKVGTLVTNLLHSLILVLKEKAKKEKCADSEPA